MPRSKDILSRVYRNLRRHGIKTEDLQDQEIYDELVIAQDRIISEIFPDRIITITLIEGEDTYDLTTDFVPSSSGSGEATIERINIASVKVAKLPSGWGTSESLRDFSNIVELPRGFVVIPNLDFVNLVNNNQNLTGRPRIANIINNKLQVYPVPTAEEEGKEIKLYVYISSSAGIIDDDNEPEISNNFDKALENYATSQFLSGDERSQFMNDFASDVKRLMPIQNRKHHNLSRSPLTGFC